MLSNPVIRKTILGTVVTVSLATGSFFYSQRSLDNLEPTHPAMQKLANCVIKHTPYDIVIIDGLRSLEEHKLNVLNGRSWISRSKHIDGLAIDFAVLDHGSITWDLEPYKHVVGSFEYCSEKLDIPIVAGLYWKSRDAGHIELESAKVEGKWVYIKDVE